MKWTAPSVGGIWVAETVIDNGVDTLNIASSNFLFMVSEDSYHFQSSIHQAEQGQIKVQGKDLLLTPTHGETYRIQILNLSSDHLQVEMIYEGIPRLVHFNRSEK